MPRTARKRAESGIYHVLLRGINKQTIFLDDEDRVVFLNRLKLIQHQMPYKVMAFCLMDNHVHLLIKEISVSISKIMQKILTSYIFWYNRKYERIGNLFQDRYKSEVVNDDPYLLCAVRYIHQNPVKAGIANDLGYLWSSHDVYINGKESFVDTHLVLDILGGEQEYLKFVSVDEEKKFLEFDAVPSISDAKVAGIIDKIMQNHKVTNISELDKTTSTDIMARLLQIPGTSIRQISRLTGVSVSKVRCAK